MSSNPYEKVNGGRLTFKGGALATRKSIDKKKKKHKKKKSAGDDSQPAIDEAAASAAASAAVEGAESGGDAYTIDAAKKMKYEQLFPVEAKKFGYDPKNPQAKSVEEALDDRVKKKADRYCK